MKSVPKQLLIALSLGAALLFGACGSPAPIATQTPAPAASLQAMPLEVSPATVAALQGSGAFVLDVREPDEWAAGHIAGATLIPLGQLPSRLAEVPTDRTVVVVCRTGHRSAQGRDILLGAGFGSVTSMAGGMTDWIAQGMPIATGQ